MPLILRSRLLAAIAVLLVSLLSACGGDGGDESALGLARVGTEDANSTTATLGPEGGTLAATGANGVAYTLTVPPGALAQPTAITMYPLSSLKGLPGGQDVQAGVHLAPEGLQLRLAATLTMDLPASFDGKRTFPMAYQGDAQAAHNYPGLRAGRRVTMPVFHFSGYAVLLELLGITDPSTLPDDTVRFLNRIGVEIDLAGGVDTVALQTGAQPIMTEWFNRSAKARLQQLAQSSDLAFWETAEPGSGMLGQDAGSWYELARFFGGVLGIRLAAEEAEAEADDLLAQALRRGIDVLNAAGRSQALEDSTRLRELMRYVEKIFEIVATADRYGLSTPANGLDLRTVREGLFIQPEISSLELPLDMRPGDTATLKVQTGLRVDADHLLPDRVGLRMEVRRLGDKFGQPSDGVTTTLGEFSSQVIWPAQASNIDVEVRAFLPLGKSAFVDGPSLVGTTKHIVRPQGARMNAVFPASISAATNLSVTVELQAPDGSFAPAADLLVSFSATCASVSPASGRADANGRFATTVTPFDGCATVSVVATASLDVGRPAVAQQTVNATVNAIAVVPNNFYVGSIDVDTGGAVGTVTPVSYFLFRGLGGMRVVRTGGNVSIQCSANGQFLLDCSPPFEIVGGAFQGSEFGKTVNGTLVGNRLRFTLSQPCVDNIGQIVACRLDFDGTLSPP